MQGLAGKWHFVLATPGGDREVDADFTVDNDGNVTGKWGPADVAGTYKDRQAGFKFPFTSDEVGNDIGYDPGREGGRRGRAGWRLGVL